MASGECSCQSLTWKCTSLLDFELFDIWSFICSTHKVIYPWNSYLICDK